MDLLVTCIPSSLKVEDLSDTSAGFLSRAKNYIPELSTLHNHRCDSLNPHKTLVISNILGVCGYT
jgi:hypothetical protein